MAAVHCSKLTAIALAEDTHLSYVTYRIWAFGLTLWTNSTRCMHAIHARIAKRCHTVDAAVYAKLHKDSLVTATLISAVLAVQHVSSSLRMSFCKPTLGPSLWHVLQMCRCCTAAAELSATSTNLAGAKPGLDPSHEAPCCRFAILLTGVTASRYLHANNPGWMAALTRQCARQ